MLGTTIKLSIWQAEVWQDSHRYKVLKCGRRAGKTSLAIAKMIDVSLSKPKQRVWYVAPTYRQAKNIVWDELKELLKGQYSSKNDTDLIMKFPNGSSIELKGSENVDNLRGVHIDLLILDEVAFMLNWEVIWKVLRPVLADSKGEAWFISTPNGFNHFKDLYELEKTKPSYKSWSFTSFDNPFLDPKEIEEMRNEMTAEAFEQEVMANFMKLTGLIYTDYNVSLHLGVLPPLDTGEYTFLRAIDFGYMHKTAVVWAALSNRHLYVYDCFYADHTKTKDLAETIKLRDKARRITYCWGDSAQPQILADLDSYGVHFDPVKKGKDSVINGIQQVASYLKYDANSEPILKIDSSLSRIVHTEFVNYHWVETKTGSASQEKPFKMNDDFLDALRYMVMGIEAVKLQGVKFADAEPPKWFKTSRDFNNRSTPAWAEKRRNIWTGDDSNEVWED